MSWNALTNCQPFSVALASSSWLFVNKDSHSPSSVVSFFAGSVLLGLSIFWIALKILVPSSFSFGDQ